MLPAVALRALVVGSLALWPLVAGPAAGDEAQSLEFEASVRRGEAFERPLPDGLVFALRPREHGWLVWLGDPAQPSANYAVIATPPFRGVNPTQIEGWHFRNADNTGPNAVGTKNVNAPQDMRAFYFVASPEAYRATARDLDVALWGAGKTADEVAAARGRLLSGVGKGAGTLEITRLELGNLVPGERAWIERMAFTVTLVPAAR
ncbi:MAG: hypothetical protein OEM59_03895 [Rhodospirillales bacterium]|nr:hypothetical protein [Rhodospirillales bacterium]